MSVAPTFLSGLSVVAISALAVCMAAPAVAQQVQDQQSVEVVGEVTRMCTVGQPTQADSGALSNFDTPTGTTFAITQLTDPTTLSTRAADITLTMDAMCNSIHRVKIASDNNGLWRDGAGAIPSGFGSAVPYRANLVWADEQYALTAEAGSRQFVEEELLIGGPSIGEMLIEFSINTGATNAGFGAPLLSGEYSDVLRVTVESQ